jgi:regulatory protein
MPRHALSLKAKALSLIAQREHSPMELRRKLLAHIDRQARAAAAATPGAEAAAPPPDERPIDELLEWLAAKDLLNTSRFIETRVTARAGRFGNLRIRQELAQHGLEADDETVAGLKTSELTRARAVWAKRFGAPAADAAARARQMRFLAARGFNAEVIRRVVRGAVEDDE